MTHPVCEDRLVLLLWFLFALFCSFLYMYKHCWTQNLFNNKDTKLRVCLKVQMFLFHPQTTLSLSPTNNWLQTIYYKLFIKQIPPSEWVKHTFTLYTCTWHSNKHVTVSITQPPAVNDDAPTPTQKKERKKSKPNNHKNNVVCKLSTMYHLVFNPPAPGTSTLSCSLCRHTFFLRELPVKCKQVQTGKKG